MKKIIPAFSLLAMLSVGCNNQTTAKENEASASEKPAKHEHQHEEMEKEDNSSAVPAVPANARVFFANLNDGDTVSSPLWVEFGIEGMEVEPAGEVHEGKGHHHVIIDGAAMITGEVVPADSVNIHYGGGQTGDTLHLPSGSHSLTLQFADGYHRSYGEQLSNTVSVIVE